MPVSSRLHVTLGDPNSVGPEVGAKALLRFLPKTDLKVFVFAFRDWIPVAERKRLQKFEKTGQLHFECDPHMKPRPFQPGTRDPKAARLAIEFLDLACDASLENARHSVLVTGPLDKELCAQSMNGFTGHTGYLQKRTKSKKSIMMLEGNGLRVSLVTTHIPLKDVSRKLTKEKIMETALATHGYLSRFKKHPHLAILGLNPHASDRGTIGDEEAKIIEPAVKALKSKGLKVEGPLSPDTAFTRSVSYSAYICMYHDQGLIPLKMQHFFDAVNITLGLPFLRTSVDHGTAFDIAGKGIASSESFFNALRCAEAWLGFHRNQRRSRA